MENVFKFFRLLKNNKGRLFVMIFSCLVFLLVLFPFDDLSDLISSQVSKASRNSITLQFDRLKMNLYPQPGIKMEHVFVETRNTPPLSAQELVIAPSIAGLIQQKPFGRISATGFLKGDVSVQMSKGARSDNGVERQKVEIKAQRLSLSDIRELADLPVMLKGQANLNSTALVDLSFTEQPEVELALNIQQFELPPSNINTPMGPLTLPDLKLGAVELRGRLSAGRFIIEEGAIGRAGDELTGTIKGNIALTLVNQGGRIGQRLGAYNFDIDLKTKRSFQDRAALFLSFIDGFKTPLADGSQYKFKVSASNPMMPPSIGASR